MEYMTSLTLIAQPSKSGYIATTIRIACAFEPRVKRLDIVWKTAIRNLGHEMHGSSIYRHQERQRTTRLKPRRRKLHILRSAAGSKVARLFSLQQYGWSRVNKRRWLIVDENI